MGPHLDSRIIPTKNLRCGLKDARSDIRGANARPSFFSQLLCPSLPLHLPERWLSNLSRDSKARTSFSRQWPPLMPSSAVKSCNVFYRSQTGRCADVSRRTSRLTAICVATLRSSARKANTRNFRPPLRRLWIDASATIDNAQERAPRLGSGVRAPHASEPGTAAVWSHRESAQAVSGTNWE
jgi:hypothetical protein